MRNFASVLGLAFTLAFAVGCSSAPASSTAASPNTEPAGEEATPEAASPSTEPAASPSTEPAPAETIPEGSKVVCHLDCSGTESKAYGATEEEARANVSKFVPEKCKPEDGQHFIFCDPVK